MTRIPPEPQPPRHVHFPPPEQMIEELLLERMKLAARGSITREALLDGAAVKTMVDMLTDSLLVSLETVVLGHDRKLAPIPLTCLLLAGPVCERRAW